MCVRKKKAPCAPLLHIMGALQVRAYIVHQNMHAKKHHVNPALQFLGLGKAATPNDKTVSFPLFCFIIYWRYPEQYLL